MTRPRLASREVFVEHQTSKGRKHRQYWSDKDNDARQYWFPLTPDGEPDEIVFSVTTILKMINKGAIPQWYADQVAAKIAAFPDASFTRTEGETFNFFRWAGSNALKEAGELGDGLHSYAERDLTGESHPEGWLDARDTQLRGLWHDLRWHHNFEPVYTEVTAWSHTHGYAGTLDGLGYLDGKLTLWDIKTSRNMWPEHKEQLAALGNVDELLIEVEPLKWQREDLPEIEQYAILHLRPDDVDSKGQFVPGYWAVHTFPVDEINQYFPTFLGALEVKKGREATKHFDKKKEAKDD
jgi:hypothetical protein